MPSYIGPGFTIFHSVNDTFVPTFATKLFTPRDPWWDNRYDCNVISCDRSSFHPAMTWKIPFNLMIAHSTLKKPASAHPCIDDAIHIGTLSSLDH